MTDKNLVPETVEGFAVLLADGTLARARGWPGAPGFASTREKALLWYAKNQPGATIVRVRCTVEVIGQ